MKINKTVSLDSRVVDFIQSIATKEKRSLSKQIEFFLEPVLIDLGYVPSKKEASDDADANCH